MPRSDPDEAKATLIDGTIEPGTLAERLAATELGDDERAVIVDRLGALVRGTTAR